MSFEQFIFYLFSLIAIGSSLMMISVKNPVKAALWLVLTFIAVAGIWILAGAEFLGLVLILVYVGAVMILFLFVVMMLDINIAVIKEGFTKYLPIGVVASVAIFALMYLVLGPDRFGIEQFPPPPPTPAGFSNTEAIGVPLYTEHVYAFILAAVLLLVAIVAAITLTLRPQRTSGSKYQDIDKQVKTQSSDRFTMVKMDATIEKPIKKEENEE